MPFFNNPIGRKTQNCFSFRRTERLTRKSDYKDLFNSGVKVASENILYYARKNDLGLNRVGIIAPKKIGGAVVRNRCRRRLREIYRTNKGVIAQGFDVAIVTKNDISNTEHEKLKKEFLEGLKRLAEKR